MYMWDQQCFPIWDSSGFRKPGELLAGGKLDGYTVAVMMITMMIAELSFSKSFGFETLNLEFCGFTAVT